MISFILAISILISPANFKTDNEMSKINNQEIFIVVEQDKFEKDKVEQKVEIKTEEKYAKLKLSKEEIEIIEKIVFIESRNQPFEGQVAVSNVILNRIISNQFPNSLKEVIFQKDQFCSAKNLSKVSEVPEAIKNAVKESFIKDVSNGSLFFLNPEEAENSWCQRNKQFVMRIGDHIFYK